MLLKKGISIVLVLAVVLLSLPLVGTLTFSANWEDVLSYQTINGGIEIEITDCDRGASREFVIPGEIDGLPVTSIGGWAFEYCTSLTSITIPDSVTSIGGWAFSDCSSLTSVTIPDGVTSIGERAFYRCSSLRSVTIPDSVTSIGDSAFYRCSLLRSVTIPDSVTSIGDWTFAFCSSLTSITIPDSVTSIGDYAFYDCYSLRSVTIPDSVTSIGNSAFSSCSSLTSVTIPDSVTSIGDWAFALCISLESVIIPDSVTSIGEYAFYNCSSLTSITIPDSVTSIGDRAFYECSSLTSVTIPDSVTSIGDFAFASCSSLESINVNANNPNYSSLDGVLFNKNETVLIRYPEGKTAEFYIIPDSVTSIGDEAFRGCSSLTSITIPNSVTSIGDEAFAFCSSLTSITIPDSVTSIGEYAFYYCSSLTSITIPNSVTSIGDRAFYECSSLTSVTIPDSVTSIGYMAFYNCSSLTSITIPDSVTSIGEFAIGYHYDWDYDGYERIPGFKIYCYPQSTGEDYAIENGFDYEFITISSIAVKTPVTQTSYYVGDTLNTAGLTLTATYNNGTTQTIASGFTCSPTALSTAGTQAVTVTYGGKTTSFNVTVKAVELSSIAIKTNPTKTNYFVGDIIDTTGLTLTATYNNGTTEVISENFAYTPEGLNTAGTQTITVTYGGKTATFNVTVKAVELSSISVKTNPTKTSYFVGDTLNTAGLTLTATYNNGTKETISSGFTCSPTTLSTAGTQAVTVTYGGKTATFNVTVKAVELSSIAVKTNPTKTNYFVGDLIDTTGLTLLATYNNGVTEVISENFTYTPDELNTAGTQAITVTYQGKTTTFNVTVKAVELSSIAIKTNPTKTSYFVGDTLNTTGLTLTATYNNGTTQTISSGFICSPTKLNTAGTQAVTVTYGGKTTTFNVTVEEVPSLDVTPESNLEINKDNEFDFVLSNTDKITASSLISNFNGGNIKIYKDGKVLGSDELVGTGCVVKLIGDGGEVIDSLTVVIKGDVDGDGVVGVTDARTVLRVAVELENFNTNAPAKLAGDVDGDGSISVTEARTILRVAVGLENSF